MKRSPLPGGDDTQRLSTLERLLSDSMLIEDAWRGQWQVAHYSFCRVMAARFVEQLRSKIGLWGYFGSSELCGVENREDGT